MTLTVNASESDSKRVAEELLDELTAWNPREWVAMFRRFPGGVSLVHLHVVSLLEVNGPMSMSRLADALDVSVASATGIVDRMEKHGLAKRERDATDRRVVLVSLSKRGASLFRRMAARRRQALPRVLALLTEDEMEAFLVGLRAMKRARAQLGLRERATP
ncbi:MAG: MarR family transcriptional regulator [Chloroflexota bacterium]